MLTDTNTYSISGPKQAGQATEGSILIRQQIGDGLCSKVFLASSAKPENSNELDQNNITSEIKTGQDFALKVFEKDEFKPMGFREYQFLKHMESHPNILKVFSYQSGCILSQRSNSQQKFTNDYCINSEKSIDYMSMEYCPNGDLFDVVKKSGPLSQKLAKALFLQLLEAVEYLHSKSGVVHLDLKLENILIGGDYQLKLCDFGFIEELKSKVLKNKGTDGYKAPEIYVQSNEGFDGDKADFFALGVILFIMLFGVPPFSIATKENAYYRLFYRGDNSHKYFFRMHPATKSLYNNGELDHELVELIMALLDENPERRPKNVEEIRQFTFLKKNLISQEEAASEMKHLIEKIHNLTNQKL